MPASNAFRVGQEFALIRSSSVRTGVYTGLCLSFIFTLWVFIANRVPVLEPFAQQRNAGAVVLLLFFAAVPFFRFYNAPGNLLLSGLLAWAVLSLTYRMLSVQFAGLQEFYGAFHIFMLGAVIYLLLATLSWIGSIVWRTRASARAPHVPQSHR